MTALPNAGVAVADVRQTIGDTMRAVLERDIDPSVDVFDQGATSLAFLRIMAHVNEIYDMSVDVAELEEASVDSLSELVVKQLNRSATTTARD